MRLHLLFIFLLSSLAYTLPARSDSACLRLKQKKECVISHNTLTDWISSDTLPTIIDLRGTPKYRNLSAQNAIALSPSAAKGKKHLQDERLLLLDEPFAARRPVELCSTLTNEGFSQIFVLSEGLYSWTRAGGKLQGRINTLPKIRTLSPLDLMRESSYEPWLILHLQSKQSEAIEDLVPEGTTVIPIETSPVTHRNSDSLTSQITEAIRNARSRSREMPVAIASDLQDLGEDALRNTLDALYRTKKLFLLSGGASALRTYVQTQAQIVASYLKKQVGPQCKRSQFSLE